MKAQICVLIASLQLFGINCVLHFTKNDLIKSLCKEKPSTELFVLEYDETKYVDVWNEENDVKARTTFHDEKQVTIKNFFKSYSKRAFSDFMPYKINTTSLSSSNSNSSVFKYKRFDKPEDLPYEITFYKGFYMGNVQGKDFYQLLGLSSQWLGCPQPMCLYGTIDAAFYFNGIIITRGPYYWELKDGPPMSSNAKLLKDFAAGVTDIIDAAFMTGSLFWFFREKKVYCWDKMKKKTCENFGTSSYQDLPSFFNVDASKSFTPEYCEAAFTFTNTENAKVALYGEEEFRKLAIFTKKSAIQPAQWYLNEKVLDFPLIFQRKIDALVNAGGTVTIFMQWNNYKVPITAFESSTEIDSKKSAAFVSFDDPFKCSKDIYSGWVYDYDKYAEEMNQIVQSEVPASDYRHRIDILESAQRVGTSKTSDEQSALPFILAAILIAAIIIIIIVILTEKKRRARKKKQQEQKQEEVDLRAPAMGSNIDTRSVMGSQILESEYKPGKKGPGSKIDSKVSGTGSTIASASKASNLGSRTSNIDAPLNRKFDSKIFSGKKKEKK